MAALVVLAYHARVIGRFTGAGQSAIEIFLVLSGFLITSVLRREQLTAGRISVPHFLRRRAWRLLPALVAYCGTVTVVALSTGWWDRQGALLSVAASLGYVMNWAELQMEQVPLALGQTWSLAIEEQYYLTWPFFLMAASRLTAQQRLRLVLVTIGCAVVWRAWIALGDTALERIRNGTDVRALALLVGGGLALLLERRSLRLEAFLSATLTGTVAIAVLMTTWFGPSAYTGKMFIGWMSLSVAAAAVLVGHLAVAEGTGAYTVRVFGASVPVFLGTISYGIYLWHPLVIDWLSRTRATHWTPVAWLASALAVSAVLAALSYVLVERPAQRWAFASPAADGEG
jgi:peptidoglycan/LPS O-acetylase OafA/YrhL